MPESSEPSRLVTRESAELQQLLESLQLHAELEAHGTTEQRREES